MTTCSYISQITGAQCIMPVDHTGCHTFTPRDESETETAKRMIGEATGCDMVGMTLVQAVAVIVSQLGNARQYRDTYAARLKELGEEYV